MPEKPIIEQIKHYQRDIVKSPNDSKRMLRCIERLTVLPVTIAHLQETGVGRSVNELRKCGGEVGAAANSLVCKWKSMVKDEEEVEKSGPESDVEIDVSKDQRSSSQRSTSSDNKNHSSSRSQSVEKHKQIRDSEYHKKPDLSHTSNKKTEPSRSESRSSMSSQHKSSTKSDHKSHTDRSAKTGSYSNSDSIHTSSQRSKSDHVSKSHKSSNSSHKSESECNGSMKNDKSSSKTKSNENKPSKSSSPSRYHSKEAKDLTQKHEKDLHKREGSSNNRYNSPKKYEIKSEDSDSTDDETVYKPSNRKRKKSDSGEEHRYRNNKHSKKTNNKEFVKKRNYDSSEESNRSDSGGGEDDAGSDNSRENVDSCSERDEEISNKSDADENLSGDEQESDRNSSADESEDGEGRSGKNSDSEGSGVSSEEEKYVPVKIKREMESPPRHSKSHSSEKSKHNHVKSSSHTSSSHSNRSKTDVAVKEEKLYEDVKIKKEKDLINTQKQKEVRSSSDKKPHKTSSSHQESTSKQSSKSDKKVKIKIEKEPDGSIDCESGASFADALMGLSDTKKKAAKRKSTTSEKSIEKSPRPAEKSSVLKPNSSSESRSSLSSSSSSFKQPDLLSKHVKLEKLEPLDVDLKSTLPEISPHYKPLPHYSPPNSPAHKRAKQLTQEEALSNIMSTKNYQRTKVYSGNKTGYAKVPSLFDWCIQVLRDNIEALEYTGGVPYDLLKPVLDRATADQLYQLEHYNPYLIEDTDGLWQFHCNKDFRAKKPDEFETWRELYLRLLDEREKKLEALKANITQSMAKSTPIRQTKLAYVDSVVKPPRNVARKQMKYGTSKAVKHELVSKAMVGAASSTPAPEVVSVPAPSRPNTSNAFPIPNFLKKKKAPLMAKTLQLIKGNRFKR